MDNIAILAYGSLIDDPGVELKPLIKDIIFDVNTPFKIEFARSSKTRHGAPTIVPVENIGLEVKGALLVLDEKIDLKTAKDLLWRRETRNENTDRYYQEPLPNKKYKNKIIIETLNNFYNFRYVIYAKIPANIDNPTPLKLAKLAINSVKSQIGLQKKDGINYLISLKKFGIKTELMDKYEEEILNLTKTSSLYEAYEKLIREFKSQY